MSLDSTTRGMSCDNANSLYADGARSAQFERHNRCRAGYGPSLPLRLTGRFFAHYFVS